nr:transmembrane protein 70, mitochondrial-like [Pelodiscus sinensis]|eukprot:XP_006131607.1 transmembrane protein 70, mitochondrial-like [Pelodiscus sinensis]
MAPNHPPSASDCGRPALLRARNPGAGGALLRAEGRLEQVIFSPATSVCCFSTSSFHGQSEDGRLIYIGNLAKAVRGVKFLSYFTSIFSLYVMLNLNANMSSEVQSLLLEPAIYGVGFMIFAIPIIMHRFTKGYVVRLYHKAETDTYTAITYNAILLEKRTVFHQRDVKVPTISKLFTTFNAKTKSMFVNPALFTYSRDYDHLMGHKLLF